MDPTMQDVREGNAVVNPDGSLSWLNAPAQVWDSGVGPDVVTVTSAAKPATDHSLIWLVLALGAAAWVAWD